MKRLLTILFALALAACIACDPPPAPPPGQIETTYTAGDQKLVVVGDSISHFGRADLHAALDPTWATKVGAMGGYTYSDMLPTSTEYASDSPHVAVVALGSNDAWFPGHPLVDSLAALEQTYDLFDDACTIGVTVTTVGDNTYGGATKATALNAATALRADVVVDWDPIGQQPGMTSPDQIHLTAEGYALRAQMIADAAATCP